MRYNFFSAAARNSACTRMRHLEILASTVVASTSPPPPVGAGWETVLSKGIFTASDVGRKQFDTLLHNYGKIAGLGLVRRDCASCEAPVYKASMYYKRLTPLPTSYDLYDALKSNWTNYSGNVFNKDFALYSTLDDALSAKDPWTSCNFDDPSGVGAFRDCGPHGPQQNQWNSWSGRGGQADVRFAVATSAKPSPPPPPPPTPPPAPKPYPGNAWSAPHIHHSPTCLHSNGWHDVAGALTFKAPGDAQDVHHIFQGCPNAELHGWSHARSVDLATWVDEGIHVLAKVETYEGMQSSNSPCSGFVTVDDEGTPCAGFRQCSSSHGATGLNPAAKGWDVPMELRCAKKGSNFSTLTEWEDSGEFILPFYFYRALPYDPVRPWKDDDGKWYVAISTDGCNATTRAAPCEAGGRLDLFTSPTLHGDGMEWTQLPAMFTTNVTTSGKISTPSAITREFVTSGYFGGLSGDPAGGKTRVVTQNNAGPTYWVGNQANGSAFVAMWGVEGAVGHYDYGSLTMARTLGSDPNQVSINGRRVLVGWIGGTPASQSLARDLSLSSKYELLQAFVPELQTLRIPNTFVSLASESGSGSGFALDINSAGAKTTFFTEIVAEFTFDPMNPPQDVFGITVLGDGFRHTSMLVDCTDATKKNLMGNCQVCTDASLQGGKMDCGPLYGEAASKGAVRLHAYVDGVITEAIWNNRTAMVTYAKPNSASCTNVAMVLPLGVHANLSAWQLTPVNNIIH